MKSGGEGGKGRGNILAMIENVPGRGKGNISRRRESPIQSSWSSRTMTGTSTSICAPAPGKATYGRYTKSMTNLCPNTGTRA